MRNFKLQIIQTLVLLVCLLQTLAQEVMAQGIESVGTDYQAILYYGKPDAGDSNDPTVFMSEPNQTIINNVKNLGCNTIFFSVSTYGSVPNENDLGLNPYPGYRDKVVDFLDLCANQNIKVFALTLDEPSYVLTANHQTALDKLFKVAYYQRYVRNLANHPQYFAKKAHFHGVVTNLEAWAAPGWKANLCDSTFRQQNNNILAQYLDLIPQMYTLLADNYFFNPPVAQVIQYKRLMESSWVLFIGHGTIFQKVLLIFIMEISVFMLAKEMDFIILIFCCLNLIVARTVLPVLIMHV